MKKKIVKIVMSGPPASGKTWLTLHLKFDGPIKSVGKGIFGGELSGQTVHVAEVINLQDDPFKGRADFYVEAKRRLSLPVK